MKPVSKRSDVKLSLAPLSDEHTRPGGVVRAMQWVSTNNVFEYDQGS